MHNFSVISEKVLELYHRHGHEKAWSYWKLMGFSYGIFLGEVPSSVFITGDDLATSIGLTAGVSQYSDTPWLKFILDGEIVLIPKKPIRRKISWEHLDQIGATHRDSLSIKIEGDIYDVTLIQGSSTAHSCDSSITFDPSYTHDSEWNRLLYPIHESILCGRHAHITPSVHMNIWESYTYIVNLIAYNGHGSYCWCIDPHNNVDRRIIRGCCDVMGAKHSYYTNSSSMNGWRPLLRLK